MRRVELSVPTLNASGCRSICAGHEKSEGFTDGTDIGGNKLSKIAGTNDCPVPRRKAIEQEIAVTLRAKPY